MRPGVHSLRQLQHWFAAVMAATLIAGAAGFAGAAGPKPAAGEAALADEESEALEAAPVEGQPPCMAALLVEAESGAVIYEHDAHTPYPPASMVKLMTAYVILGALKNGALHLEDPVQVSARASKMGGSQVYLKQGEQFTVDELMLAMLVHSANDAAVALAEHVAGTVEGFVTQMNKQAADLGMKDSVFRTVDGLPPGRDQEPDMSSAHDMAVLARRLVQDYPQILGWTRILESTFRGGEFKLTNSNKLLARFPGADGLKTGYYRKAGFCVSATAMRDDVRMIAVVMGCAAKRARLDEAARLLALGFMSYGRIKLAGAGEPVAWSVPVASGKPAEIRPVLAADVHAVLPYERAGQVRAQPGPAPVLEAPLAAGAPAGKVVFVLDGREVAAGALVVSEPVPPAGLWDRIRGWFGSGGAEPVPEPTAGAAPTPA